MGFLAPTIINIKITVFWNVMACSAVDRYHAFERTAATIFRVENIKAILSFNNGTHPTSQPT